MSEATRISKRSYAIVGVGAIGGYYGGLLARAGLDVKFLLRSDYDHVAAHGLRVESPRGEFHLERVHAYDDPQDMPRCDAAVVCLKTTHLGTLGDVLPRIVKPGGVVVAMMNGLNVEREIASILPGHDVLGALCFVCCHKVGPGHVRHLDYGRVKLGAYDGDGDDRAMGLTPPVRAIADDFAAAGIDVEAVDDLVRARWQKLAWNVPFNGLSVALQTTTDRIVAHPASLALADALMKEVAAGCAASSGRTIETAFLEKMVTDTRAMAPYRTSMLLDYAAGRPLEVEAIFGEPLREAAAGGCELPLLRSLYRQLCFLGDERVEARRAARQAAPN